MANVTAIRRFIYIHNQLRKREGAASPNAGAREEELTGWFQARLDRVGDCDRGRLWHVHDPVEVVGIYTGTSRALGAALGAVTNFTVNKVYTSRRTRTRCWWRCRATPRSRSPRSC